MLCVEMLINLLFLITFNILIHSTGMSLLSISTSLDSCSTSQLLHSTLLSILSTTLILLIFSAILIIYLFNNVPISKLVSIYLYLIIYFLIKNSNLLLPTINHP